VLALGSSACPKNARDLTVTIIATKFLAHEPLKDKTYPSCSTAPGGPMKLAGCGHYTPEQLEWLWDPSNWSNALA
jgi:hypothetical protein